MKLASIKPGRDGRLVVVSRDLTRCADASAVAHAATTRPLGAGVIVGSGTVSNRDADGGPGKPIGEGGVGYSCIAELRSVETILHVAPKTPFLNYGDGVRIEMNDPQGRSIFGAIEQDVVRCINAASP